MLYIIRHGKTDWNLKHKLQGKTDIPLNDIGRQMAKEAGELYREIHLDVCYCSPLLRARETAGLLLEGRDVPVIIDERLSEMGFGIYEGVENELDEQMCIKMSASYLQGYKYSRPIPIERLTEFFDKKNT